MSRLGWLNRKGGAESVETQKLVGQLVRAAEGITQGVSDNTELRSEAWMFLISSDREAAVLDVLKPLTRAFSNPSSDVPNEITEGAAHYLLSLARAATDFRAVTRGEILKAAKLGPQSPNAEYRHLQSSNDQLYLSGRSVLTAFPPPAAVFSYDRACMRSRRRVARRASSEQTSTIVTRTSAPAHACRCQSSYGPVAYVNTWTVSVEIG